MSSVTQKMKQSKGKLSKAHMTEKPQERGLEVSLKYYLAIILFGVAGKMSRGHRRNGG